jgi:hypothetical protein
MTLSVPLNPRLQEGILSTARQQADAIADAARAGAVSIDNQFIFFAAFDGTNNDLETTGHGQNTNVAQLFLQAQAAQKTNPNLQANYYPGPGTKGTLRKSDWLNDAVTKQVKAAAKNAYDDFARAASAWLDEHPGGAITVALTSFSRGVASAAIFTQSINDQGLIDPTRSNRALIAPGEIEIAAGVLFDPVATGVEVNVAFAPNVSNVVNIVAQDEYRDLFMAVDYSGQSAITTVAMLGNHCDIGGGYDNGIAALTLEAATEFFRNSGVPLGPIDDERRFKGVDSIAIHSEERDDNGRRQWDVYAEFLSQFIKNPSPREFADGIKVTPFK